MPGRVAWLAAFTLISITGCDACVRHVECRMKRDLASCQRAPDCKPTTHCVLGAGPGRCSSACVPEGPACGLHPGARPDNCILDGMPGHEPSCFSADHKPGRCQLARDARGYPTCIDADAPCAGCSMAFDTCVAKERCFGIVCF